jgi:hypothetical protein
MSIFVTCGQNLPYENHIARFGIISLNIAFYRERFIISRQLSDTITGIQQY